MWQVRNPGPSPAVLWSQGQCAGPGPGIPELYVSFYLRAKWAAPATPLLSSANLHRRLWPARFFSCANSSASASKVKSTIGCRPRLAHRVVNHAAYQVARRIAGGFAAKVSIAAPQRVPMPPPNRKPAAAAMAVACIGFARIVLSTCRKSSLRPARSR